MAKRAATRRRNESKDSPEGDASREENRPVAGMRSVGMGGRVMAQEFAEDAEICRRGLNFSASGLRALCELL